MITLADNPFSTTILGLLTNHCIDSTLSIGYYNACAARTTSQEDMYPLNSLCSNKILKSD